jgi:hypothetical protein
MRNPKLSDEEVMDEVEGRMRNKDENDDPRNGFVTNHRDRTKNTSNHCLDKHGMSRRTYHGEQHMVRNNNERQRRIKGASAAQADGRSDFNPGQGQY